ncbi:MAG: PAS domain-containing protein [Bacteroidota bacterium]
MHRLPQIIEQSNLIYYMGVSYGGDYLFANSYFLDRFNCHGLNDGSIQVMDTIIEEDWAKVVELFEICKKHPGESFEIIIRKPSTKGDVVHTSWEFVADGEAKEIICIGFDITQRVAYSRKAWEFGKKLNQIIDSITDGFYSLDRKWRFTLVNQNFLDTVGKTRDEVIGNSIWDLFPDDDGYQYPKLFRKAMNDGMAQKFEEYRPDLDRWYWSAAYPSDDGLLVFFKDITERKVESSALEDSKNKLTAILNSTAESHMLISPEYRMLSFNKTASNDSERLYGKKMAVGMNLLDYVAANDIEQFQANFTRALSGELVINEVIIDFPNDKQKWFRMELSPARNEANETIGVVINSVDIDELKRYEHKLERSNEQLRAIAYQQSHEMRSPIAKVLGLMNLLKSSPGDTEVMAHIEKVTHQLDTIVHDIIEKTEEA